LKIFFKIIMFIIELFSAIELTPRYGFAAGLSLKYIIIVAALVMVIKVVVELIIIRVGFDFVAWLVKHYHIFTTRVTTNSVIITSRLFRRFRIVYLRKTSTVRNKFRLLKDWLYSLLSGLGLFGIFLAGLLPLPTGLAIIGPILYNAIAEKKHYKWYQYNNWYFILFLLGCEIRMFLAVITIYEIIK